MLGIELQDVVIATISFLLGVLMGVGGRTEILKVVIWMKRHGKKTN